MDFFYASILYVIAALVLNYIIKPAVVKQLIVWNIAVFLVYLIIVVIVTARKK